MIKNILIFTMLICSIGYTQNNKVATDGIRYPAKYRAGAGDSLTGMGASRFLLSLADGYIKVQVMKDGNPKDTHDIVLYLNQGQVFPIAFVRKIYALYNGSDSCQTKCYIGNTLNTGVYFGW